MRSIAHYESDARRNLKPRSDKWLKGYVGRSVIHILVADEVALLRNGTGILTPSVRNALKLLTPLVQESGE